MNTSNKYDSIESLIFESGLRISSIAVHKPQDLMIVFLNSGASLLIPISKYRFFSNASQEQLVNYTLIADGVGINWPDLDEDIGVEGLLLGLKSGESQASLGKWLQNRRGAAQQ